MWEQFVKVVGPIFPGIPEWAAGDRTGWCPVPLQTCKQARSLCQDLGQIVDKGGPRLVKTVEHFCGFS